MVSEELKKQAREFLRQSFDARWKRADPGSGLSREEQQITTMAEFAAQVCEQREKVGFCEKHAPNPSQSYAGCWVCSRNEETELLKEVLRTFGWMKDKEAGWYLAEDSDAADGPKFYDFHDAVAAALDDYEALRAAYKKSHLYGAGQLQRAEAAELALRQANSEIATLNSQVFTGRDALQAKEQDVAKLFKEVSLLNGQLARAEARELARESELAQARQQAIAETVEQCASIATVAANAMGQKPAIARVEALRIADEIRSLTPPPALTLDVNRCAVCGWPLSETAEKGCVRGNCSLRPRPGNLYDPERAAAERVVPPALTKEK